MQMAANEEQEFKESVVFVNRVSKVVKGGRRFGFSAMVVVGDGNGSVGIGYGKAKDVSDAIKKGVTKAKKEMYKIKTRNNTIPHAVTGVHSGAKVFLRPASPGTGVIAGGAVRAIIESWQPGYLYCLVKLIQYLILQKPGNKALISLKNAREVARLRGIPVERLYS